MVRNRCACRQGTIWQPSEGKLNMINLIKWIWYPCLKTLVNDASDNFGPLNAYTDYTVPWPRLCTCLLCTVDGVEKNLFRGISLTWFFLIFPVKLWGKMSESLGKICCVRPNMDRFTFVGKYSFIVTSHRWFLYAFHSQTYYCIPYPYFSSHARHT